MSDLRKNAISFLQKRFPVAPVVNGEIKLTRSPTGTAVKTCWPMIALDMHSGVKQRAIAIENLGDIGELASIAQNMHDTFNKIDGDMLVEMSNSLDPKGHKINTTQMTYAPRILIYTNKSCMPIEEVMQIFDKHNDLVDVVDESKIHKTLFICYGGDDEKLVAKLNKLIKAKGIQTWFFPDDAPPGEKLHRVMHEGVNNHDRVLLVCSKNSLGKNGVLNEIERVLEREAKEGGADILIPVTFDDYVYDEWKPARNDIAEQVRSRVITKVNIHDKESSELEEQVIRIAKVLK